MMQNFQIFETPDQEYPLFMVVLFCHSKVNQRMNMVHALQERNYVGWILVDNLMQAGVEGLRFYKTYFDKDFKDQGFPIQLPKDSPYRKITCDFIREHNLATGSSLSNRKIDAINRGEII